jgi:methylmalonyl-CoA mutase
LNPFARHERYRRKRKNLDVFLVNMGPVRSIRVSRFFGGFFEVGHFNVIRNDGFPTIEEAVLAAVKSQLPSLSFAHRRDIPQLVPPCKAFKRKMPGIILILAEHLPRIQQRISTPELTNSSMSGQIATMF